MLIAHDAGDVLFFCGAGVSFAQARLPDFATLAESVLNSLGSASESPARRVFEASRKFEEETKLRGLVATDRVFGMLEREFDPRDVRSAVAAALKPKNGVSLAAHRILLDLSTSPTGSTRLVTTNFDRLFEQCDPGLKHYSPPSLPDPLRPRDFNGVIHLHGCVDHAYRHAIDDELVLSSADFGHAYLSDGWAVRYIQRLLQRFTIVFVGYSADDPPVQYLLEALNRFSRSAHRMYAFQEGVAERALAQWSHKGVVPIPFDASNNFGALWNTLLAWSQRAVDTEGWHRKTLDLARDGPTSLTPVQRGQFVHLLRTELGTSLLAQAMKPPPAEWLISVSCGAFALEVTNVGGRPAEDDAEPLLDFKPDEAETDDLLPAALARRPQEAFEERFDASLEPAVAADGHCATGIHLKGPHSIQPPSLSPRLLRISEWIASVAPQPAALWWASRQIALHPTAVALVERELRYHRERFTPAIRGGWRLLLQAWQQTTAQPPFDRYDIQREADSDGWSRALVRQAIALFRPRIEVQNHRSNRPPGVASVDSGDPVVDFDVEYPRPPEPFEFPDAQLPYALEQLRQTLQYAVDLERDVNPTGSLFFDTVRTNDGSPLDEDGHGLTGPLATFVNMMRRLMTVDSQQARKEATMWAGRSDALFTHLRIWAFGQQQLCSGVEAAEQTMELCRAAFWEDLHERDLLISLRDRWAEFTEAQRRAIEGRLIDEPQPYDGMPDESNFVAHQRLNRLHWLMRHGAKLSADSFVRLEELRRQAPRWTDDALETVAQPRFGQVYAITTDFSPAELTALPLGRILEEDLQAQRRDAWSKVQKHPFPGLAQERLPRALVALTDAKRKGQFPDQAWNVVLQSDGPDASNCRVLHVISWRLSRLTQQHLAEISHSVTQWMFRHAKQLVTSQPEAFEALWKAMLRALALETAMPSDTSWQWSQHASNRPAGKLVEVASIAAGLTSISPGQTLPTSWKLRMQQLVALPIARRPYAIAALTRLLPRLHQAEPEWTCELLHRFAERSGPDGEAFWAGFAASPSLPAPELFGALWPHLAKLPASETLERRLVEKLAATLLNQWLEDKPEASHALLSSTQLRDVLIRARNSFRVAVLRQLRRWAARHNDAKAGVLRFLKDAWPKQLTARSPTASQELIELALSVPDLYSAIMDVVLPALVPVADPYRVVMPLKTSVSLARQYPATMLSMLSVALAGHRLSPTPELSAVLLALQSCPEVLLDSQLSELFRRSQIRTA
ncbi:SIR2 family protein [Pseudorhodoferax soli]|uniref:SIR2 family protein n=1 Tax=Pseudorhodoferax soli TaxID=545864 RepID=UPI001B880DD5|nr:SIR2 family protein [Pseudorhodoferax soli]